MNGWVVAELVLAFLFLLLLVPLSVVAHVQGGEVRVYLWVGFLRLTLVGSEKREKAKKSKRPSEKKKPEKKDEKPGLGQYIQGLDDVMELAGIAKRLLKKLLRAVRIAKLRLTVTVATADAAQTALLYGRLNAAAGILVPVLHEYLRIRNDHIRFWTDFQKEKTEFSLYVRVTTTPAALLGVAGSALVSLLRYLWPRRAAERREAIEAAINI